MNPRHRSFLLFRRSWEAGDLGGVELAIVFVHGVQLQSDGQIFDHGRPMMVRGATELANLALSCSGQMATNRLHHAPIAALPAPDDTLEAIFFLPSPKWPQFHLQTKFESQQNKKSAMLVGGVLANKQQNTAQPVFEKETKHNRSKWKQTNIS